jgi:CTP:molybdopterin cytidylyltransferase MocA
MQGLTVVGNDAWPTGMASSVRAAVAWATPLPCTGLLLMVCDQPHLDHLHLDALIAARTPTMQTVGSAYNGTIGVPAVFGRPAFPDLAALTGDRGARALLVRPGVTAIAWPAGAIDVDTPADLAAKDRPAPVSEALRPRR